MEAQVSSDDAAGNDLTAGGTRLKHFLGGLHVEFRWIAGHHIVWQTGQQNGPSGAEPADHTHCSAFAAAAAMYLDIYALRPPQHSEQFLADAQVDWLNGTGDSVNPTAAASGWRTLGKSGADGVLDNAVAAANAGKLVIGGYYQAPVTDPGTGVTQQKSGHIVVVRPQEGVVASEDGPQVIMAGDRNWQSTSMRNAFSSHVDAWPDQIQLFVHDTDLEHDTSAL